jgi:hypothetical protein
VDQAADEIVASITRLAGMLYELDVIDVDVSVSV